VIAPDCAGAHLSVAYDKCLYSGIKRQSSLARARLAQPKKPKDEDNDDNQADNVDDLIHGRPAISGFIGF
jgi:hypothetical protein